jgi:hypothetical protein
VALRYTWTDSATPVALELYYSGGWQDVTDYLSREGWSITRGLAGEGSAAAPQELKATLANGDGRFSTTHPESPLYGLAGRATPVRLRIYTHSTWYTRFVGEVAEWSPSWGLKGAPSSVMKITASGITRRLGDNSDTTRSSLYRGLAAADAHLIAYWPLEDGDRSTQWTCERGGSPGQITGTPSPGAEDGFWCSDPVTTIGTSRHRFVLPEYTDTGEWQIRVLLYVKEAIPTGSTLLSVDCPGGSITSVGIIYDSAAGGALASTVTYSDSTSNTHGSIAHAVDGKHILVSLEVEQDGADVGIRISTLEQGQTVGTTDLKTESSQTIGRARRVIINPERRALYYLATGHLQAEDAITSLFAFYWELNAWAGESAAHRISRLAVEAGTTASIVGDDYTSQRLGRQGRASILDLIQEAAEVGRGLLYEDRTDGLIAYRALAGLVNQDPAADLTYVDNLIIPFTPVLDDRYTVNRCSVTRQGGATATVEDSTSPMGSQPSPDGVGLRSLSVTRSLSVDAQALDQAGWTVSLGTVPGARWPALGINLAHPVFLGSASLTADVLSLDVGDRLDITSPPAWLSPDAISGLVLGYTETVNVEDYQIALVLAPYEPYRVAVATTGGADGARWTNGTTVTTEALDSTETGIDITSTRPPYWTHADGDYDLRIGGEVMTVTAVTGAGPAQTMTVTRSVNGVIKAHGSGARVELAEPQHWGLGQ